LAPTAVKTVSVSIEHGRIDHRELRLGWRLARLRRGVVLANSSSGHPQTPCSVALAQAGGLAGR